MSYFFVVLFALSGLVTFAQQQVHFSWKEKPFVLNEPLYLNDSTTIQVEQFKFYVQRLNDDKPNSIHLIDAADDATWQWISPAAPMQVGIQAAIQTAGVFTGDLDPINGMYWAWNTGFISVKCVGVVMNVKSGTQQKFEYHLGGYQAPFACIKTIPGSGLHLNCNLSLWFASILNSDTSEWLIMQPGKASLAIFELFTASLRYDQ
jgi:hypothetical protein